MAAKEDLSIPLLPGKYYHMYNRGINRCRIFYTEENFKYFLKKYAKKMTGYFDTFAYCLLDNHFHIFVRVCDAEALIKSGLDDFGSVKLTFHKDYIMPWLQRMGLLDLDGSTRSGLLAGVGGKWDQVGGRDRDRYQEGQGDLTNFQNLSNQYAIIQSLKL